jgi:CHAT domain-containing protein
MTGIDNASITLLANQDITTANITAPAGIRINSSSGDITTRNLTTASSGDSGNIAVTSVQGTIRTGSLNASSNSGNGGAIALTARNDVTTDNITTQASEGTGGTIAVTSRDGAVRTGNLRSAGAIGGDVRVVASDRIQTDQINSSASIGNGGDVLLDPSGNITVGFINAQGGENGLGGTVDITTGQLFLASDRFTDRNGIDASISTAGGNGGGSITIQHSGGALRIPFNVGDATVNGTAGAITTGTDANGTIFPFRSFPGSYTQGDIRIITQDPPVAPPQTEIPPSLPDLPPIPVVQSTPLKTLADAREILQQVEEATGIRPALIYAQFVPAPTPAAAWFDQREASFTQQFEEHLQGSSNIAAQPLLTARDTDELELLLVTAEGPPVARRLRGVTRAQVMAVANRFRNEVTDVRKTRTRSYLAPAQQLYNWLVAPLAADLQTRQVQNLVFLPDVGLRSVPFAALHDGSQFLVQRYSVGLMPSLSLADTRYVDIRDSEVLAMGASQFSNQIALPAVPVELSAIAHQLWRGETFLNQNFTPDNLRTQRQEHPFGIVHLATHAEFEPGTPDQSYIQFWNTQLRLNQLRQLGLNDPPVNLMVLSACRTALGNADAELGFAGLATQAGVKSVMASLWYVSDAGTLTLMTEFYDQLRHAPIKAEALRQAQLLMATGQIHLVNGQLQGLPNGETVTLPPDFAELDDTDFSHPYYWSAFTMVGNPW